MSTPSTTSKATATPHPATDVTGPTPRRLPVWQALLGSVAVSLGTWVVLSPLADLSLSTTSNGANRDVGALAVGLSAVVVTLAAVAVAALVRRLSSSPRRTFLVVSAVVCVLSFSGPIGQATTMASGLGLSLLHLVVTAAVVPTLAASLPARRA